MPTWGPGGATARPPLHHPPHARTPCRVEVPVTKEYKLVTYPPLTWTDGTVSEGAALC